MRTPMQETNKEGSRLRLMDLINEKKPIWVVNRSKEKLGNALYIFLSLKGGIYVDPIPPGDDPVCLTDKIPHKYLEEATDLFRLVDRGILELVDESVATEYYAKHPERKEVVKAKIDSLTATSEGGSPRGFREMVGRRVMRQPEGTAVTQPGRFEVSPRIKWLVNALKADVISNDVFKTEVESMKDVLTDVDKAYIKQEVPKVASLIFK